MRYLKIFSRPLTILLSFFFNRFKHDVELSLTCPHFGEDQTQLVKFTDYLKALECHVDHPNSDFIICQQVIAQWFALKGNISFRWENMYTNVIMYMYNIVGHSSEIWGLCLMKWPGKTVQNLPYFIYMKTQRCFLHYSFHFMLLLYFTFFP